MMNSDIGVSGELTMVVTRAVKPKRIKPPLWWRAKNALRMLLSGEALLPAYVRLLRLVSPRGVAFVTAELRGEVTRADGTVVDYGVLGRHLVTTAGKAAIASAFDNTIEAEIFKYHGFGTGATAAAAGDTALQTECTTAYATDNTRPTGSQAHSAATYTTVATFTPDAAVANTEWGLFSQASNAGGTLLDRQVYSAVNLNGSGDSLATTYVLTIS